MSAAHCPLIHSRTLGASVSIMAVLAGAVACALTPHEGPHEGERRRDRDCRSSPLSFHSTPLPYWSVLEWLQIPLPVSVAGRQPVCEEAPAGACVRPAASLCHLHRQAGAPSSSSGSTAATVGDVSDVGCAAAISNDGGGCGSAAAGECSGRPFWQAGITGAGQIVGLGDSGVDRMR